MKETLTKMARELRYYWKNYVLQCGLAGLTIFVILMFADFESGIIVASMGSTAFIVFGMPQDYTARARNVIGGHAAGLVSGFLCMLIPHHTVFITIVLYSLAVGLSIFIMVITDTEHPPASGTALGVAVHGFSWNLTFEVMASAVVLSLINFILRKHLRDLA